MGIVYPGGIDSFNEPSLPETTPLSEAGTGSRNHVEHHHDLGAAIIALQQNASFKDHDHSGVGGGNTAHGNKLSQANTHQNADTDSSPTALHHTLGNGANQAAPGNHTHDYRGDTILNKPYIITTHAEAPATAPVGTLLYETDTGVLKLYSGSGSSALFGSAKTLPVSNFPVCTVVQNSNQTLNTNGSYNDVRWDAATRDNYGMFGGGSGTYVTIQETGLYSVEAKIQWNPGVGVDNSLMRIVKNNADIGISAGANLVGNLRAAPFSQTTACNGQVRCNSGDSIKVQVAYTKTGVGSNLINAGQTISNIFFGGTNIDPTQVRSSLTVTYISP